YFFEVVNVKKPAAICITTLTARLNPMDLDQNGEVDTATVIVWAEEFDRSSEVACDDEYLEYRVELLDGIDDDDTFLDDTSYIELGCDHVGVQMVRLWVISQPSGTVDFCDVLLVVQSDFSGCVGNQSGEKGQISNVTDMHDETSDPYKEMMGKKDVEISGDAGMPASIGVEGYRLEQNRPNPFQTETRIGFVLAESGLATVTIYDIRGKVLRSIQGDFSKGYNEVRLNKESLGTSSIMYYQLQSGDYTETRKMIMIQ
ncbi:MAG: T9SS type A sorting domain-containing protein, partial [Saprospiraceae bacterium]|nr:T9SS type A sorting domain-containing protein [Saprospiraceae bacterium]